MLWVRVVSCFSSHTVYLLPAPDLSSKLPVAAAAAIDLRDRQTDTRPCYDAYNLPLTMRTGPRSEPQQTRTDELLD